jgi:hypothetical protein
MIGRADDVNSVVRRRVVRSIDGRSVAEHGVERPSVDVLHHDEVEAVVRAELVDGGDVRVAERRRGSRLEDEAPKAIGVAGNVGRKDLQRNVTRERLVGRSDLKLAVQPRLGEAPVAHDGHARHAQRLCRLLHRSKPGHSSTGSKDSVSPANTYIASHDDTLAERVTAQAH